MTTKFLLKSSALAALAAALAMAVAPQTSFAQGNDRPSWRNGSGDRGSARSNSGSRSERSSASRGSSSSSRSGQSRSAQSEAPRPQAAPRADYTPPRQVSVPASRTESRAVRSEAPRGDANRGSRGNWAERRGAGRSESQPAPTRSASPAESGRDRSYGADRSASRNVNGTTWAEQRGLPDPNAANRGGSRGGDRDGDRNRDRDGRDGNRGGNWGDRDGRDGRDGNRDRNWNDRDRRDGDRWNDRDRRDGNRNWNGRDGRGYDRDRDHRRWDRRWRDNNRYDWNGWRNRNRTVFHLGIYYAPYRNYSYSRVGVGFYLDSLFFGSRYWINDPWQYRLPEVYGPYRWVRYYDDVLLVDIYTGEVVDVIYDFFW